jgi:tetratricopeptide (TPR) repeat protein
MHLCAGLFLCSTQELQLCRPQEWRARRRLWLSLRSGSLTKEIDAMPVCLEYKKYFPKILGLLWLICFLGGVGLHTSQAKDTFKDMVIKKQISARGLDPHAYSTAQQMYCVAPFKEMDENGNALLTEFEQAMQTGALWNFPQSVERIMALEPYRNNQDLRNRIVSHTKTVFDKDFIPKDRLSDCITAFAEANQLYRDGNFKDAADLYLSILAAEPENKEARNNFSLSHMHMGNDLIAWANLHMLTQKYSNYVPAWVNLTVVLERLDESDSAKQAMLKAIELESDRPDTSARFFLIKPGSVR